MPLVAEVVRSGFVESRHHGSVVAVAASGEVLFAAGDPAAPVFPRSSNKPLQAAAMLRLGLVRAFDLSPRHVALAAASHSGEPVHVALAREILARAGLDEGALRCGTDGGPLDLAALRAVYASGRAPERIHHNCSGKHAAMLATCVANGWPVDSYLAPDHPLQVAVRATAEELAGERIGPVGVDGCGAPLFALSLAGLARAFSRLVLASPGTAERTVADAMRAHPDVVGGTSRDVTALMRAVPGLLAKDGAEAVYAAALADGRAVAVKIADGGARARTPVLIEALRALGVAADFAGVPRTPITGAMEPVGEVRAVPLPGVPAWQASGYAD